MSNSSGPSSSTHLRFDVPVDDSAAMAVGKGRQKLVHVELRSSGNDMFDIAHCHDRWAPGFPSRDEEKSGGTTIIIPSGLRCPLSCNNFQQPVPPILKIAYAVIKACQTLPLCHL